MNIKRGLFRLWLVCALLFAAFVMLLSYEKIVKEFKRSNLLAEIPANGTALVPVHCKDARGALDVDYELDASTTKKEPEDLCWYKMARFRTNFPEYNNFSDEEAVTKTYTEVGVPIYPAHPWRMLLGLFGFTIGVPLVFLVIGSAFVWAFSGFSRPKES